MESRTGKLVTFKVSVHVYWCEWMELDGGHTNLHSGHQVSHSALKWK